MKLRRGLVLRDLAARYGCWCGAHYQVRSHGEMPGDPAKRNESDDHQEDTKPTPVAAAGDADQPVLLHVFSECRPVGFSAGIQVAGRETVQPLVLFQTDDLAISAQDTFVEYAPRQVGLPFILERP